MLLKREYESFTDFAVLYRTNAQSYAFEKAFINMHLPYKIVGGVRFYDRKEVKDVLAAPSEKPALVRWTLVTEAVPEITSDGIVLEQKGMKMLLKTEGGKVSYRIWSSDPKDYDNPVKEFDEAVPGVHICGYEVEVPASAEMSLVTTLKKID